MNDHRMTLAALLGGILAAIAPGSQAAIANGSIVTMVSGDKCLGIQGNGRAQQQVCSSSPNQQWKLLVDSAGNYVIKNVESGNCLDVPSASKESVVLQQWGCSDGPWQKWKFRDAGAGAYIVTSVSSGLAVDADLYSSNVLQYRDWNGPNQHWTVNPIAGQAATAAWPPGFAAGTTGGAAAGTETVTVTHWADLAKQLCGSVDAGGICTDNKPRIIKIVGMLDFRHSEGLTTARGCNYFDSNYCPANATANGKFERSLNTKLHYCAPDKQYDITYDNAAGKPLLVGSNKTVIGVGPNSGIQGKGLAILGREGFNVSNVIIRNLRITDINDGIVWAGDAININGGKNIWIDHNYFNKIGRQMIVTGWGTAQNVTISGNEFDGTTEYGHFCNGRAFWALLLNGDDQTISLISNHITHTSGRSPELGGKRGIVHIANNYYDDNFYVALSGTNDAAALVEGNHFSNGSYKPIFDNTPNKTNAHSNLNFAVSAANQEEANQVCLQTFGRACQVNAARSDDDFLINRGVMDTIRKHPDSGHLLAVLKSFKPIKKIAEQKFGPQAGIEP